MAPGSSTCLTFTVASTCWKSAASLKTRSASAIVSGVRRWMCRNAATRHRPAEIEVDERLGPLAVRGVFGAMAAGRRRLEDVLGVVGAARKRGGRRGDLRRRSAR